MKIKIKKLSRALFQWSGGDSNQFFFLLGLNILTTFSIRSSDLKQKLRVEAREAKTQQMYEDLELGVDLKLLFMVTGLTGAYY